MKIKKLLPCILLCFLILFVSCFPALAAEAEPTKPKNYSQMSEAELLANNQIPIDYIIKTIQKQIDKTIKDDDGKEIRLYEFSKYVKQEDGTTKTEKVPVGKFNLSNFLQDKKFILQYYVPVDKEDKGTFKKIDKEKVYIKNLYIFDSVPFIDAEYSNTAKPYPNYEQGAFLELFRLYSKPSHVLKNTSFYTLNENTVNQSFNIKDGSWTADRSDGIILSLEHVNSQVLSTTLSPLPYQRSFYMNFMPEGGDGLLNNFVVTDKDISSEKQYIDDPNRPDGKYQYAVYEFQNNKMIAAQYFTEKPDVYKKESGDSIQYEVLFNRHKNESGEVIDRENWEIWMPENETYIWLTVPNSYSTPSKTPATYHYTDDSTTSVKFSWKPFDDYNGEIYEDNAVLVDGQGFSTKRPTGSYPYVMRRYVNSQLYETFFFQYAPNVHVSNMAKNSEKRIITADISVNTFTTMLGQAGGIPWYSKKQDVFFVPKDMTGSERLDETYAINAQFTASGEMRGNYLTFNWDAGAASDLRNQFNPFYDKNGDKLDGFYDEFDEDITDDEGNKVGQGDGSKPEKDKEGALNSEDFKFDFETLKGYATNAFDFLKSTFSVLPEWIWLIIGGVIVIIIVLRILSR